VIEGNVKRRLAAILAADVAGYSRLMGDDERATIATLREYREVFRERIGANGGRVVDMAGDAVLAVFDSASGAVAAATETQGELAKRNEGLSDERRMVFRIGVNLGDIEEADDGTVYGDGVNVAARLEAMANPGGINVSGSVFDSVRSKSGLAFNFLGEQQVKNIADPVRAYRIGEGGKEMPSLASQRANRRKLAAGIVAAIVLVALGSVAWWLTVGEKVPQMVTAKDKPIRPSIAVLPFTNMSDDVEQDYFADGISEDLITELSRFEGLLVIARTSTFRYKGQAVDIGEVATALGVRYVLEGGVRRIGDRVRITAQLIDVETGGHL
jgi:adenylate cyclase